MALNINNDEVERLAADVARITSETKTEAIRRSLAECRDRLRYRIAAGTGGSAVSGSWSRKPGRTSRQISSLAISQRLLGTREIILIHEVAERATAWPRGQF